MTTDWREAVARGAWEEVAWLSMSPFDQRAFLAHLRTVVPFENGAYLTEDQVEPSLKFAAQILQLGELEMSVVGTIRSASDEWSFDLPRKSGEHQLRNQEVFHGKREQTDAGVSA